MVGRVPIDDFRDINSAFGFGCAALKVKAFSDWTRKDFVVAGTCALEINRGTSKADGSLIGISDKLEVGLMCPVLLTSFNA
jgi:hypothetical protein